MIIIRVAPFEVLMLYKSLLRELEEFNFCKSITWNERMTSWLVGKSKRVLNGR